MPLTSLIDSVPFSRISRSNRGLGKLAPKTVLPVPLFPYASTVTGLASSPRGFIRAAIPLPFLTTLDRNFFICRRLILCQKIEELEVSLAVPDDFLYPATILLGLKIRKILQIDNSDREVA